MDFIFLIGPSAVGKTTLAKELYKHYEGVYIEQNMVPEFNIPNSCADEGIFEEQICWENVLLQLKYFYQKGFRNIVALDFDDLRVREIPKLFKGYKFIIVRLVSTNPQQLINQMEKRHQNEGGLYIPDQVLKHNEKIKNRKTLPNEIIIDINNKSKDQVLIETINKIDNFTPEINYKYRLDDKNKYLSWVLSNNLK